MSIIDHTPPGWTLRPGQRELLLAIEAGWDQHDVVAAMMPTGAGKTLVSVTIARWQAAQGQAVNYTQPDNVLVEQSAAKFPELNVLRRKDTYYCRDLDQDCAATKRRDGGYCKDCPYVGALKSVKKSKLRLMNYYVYWAYRLYAPVLIVDEAHKLIDMLQDKRDVKIWRSDHKFPDGLITVADVLEWAQKELAKRRADTRLARTIQDVRRVRDGASVEYREDVKRGKPDTVLHVLPSTTKTMPPWLWPAGKVRKVVLLSATIGPKDVAELGLDSRRVLHLSCDSPIPASNRPFVYEPKCNMALQYRAKALPTFVHAVQAKLAEHPNKGLIHLPYSLAERFQEIFDHPRLLFHDRDNKADVLERFKASDPSEGYVLVASGLYEGLDLPFDAARWQILGVVPYQNLGDERVKAKAQADPGWYAWEAAKKILQTAGRIVRSADDYGTTYLFDTNFERLYREHRELFPKFFRDAVRVKR